LVVAIFWSGFVSSNPFDQLTNFTSQQLAENLYTLKSNNSNTNIGIFIGTTAILLIDPVVGKTNNSALISAIKQISDKPIKYVINTHSHRDHSGENTLYTELGATIVQYSPQPEINKITFKNSYILDMGNEKIKLFHFVSHSADDVIIQFDVSNVIFMGDTYMHHTYPHAYVGGSEGLYAVIEKTLSLANDSTQIITAHGRFISSRSEFIDFKRNATAWYKRIVLLSKQAQQISDIAQDAELIKVSQFFRTYSAKFLEQRVAKTIKSEKLLSSF
jgi:glyoxylase-like metal-dependent hydrolase (beta-lactamase superfamily II)